MNFTLIIACLLWTLTRTQDVPILCNRDSRFKCVCRPGNVSDPAVPLCTDFLRPGSPTPAFKIAFYGCSNGLHYLKHVDSELRRKLAQWLMQECSSTLRCDDLTGPIRPEDVVLLDFHCPKDPASMSSLSLLILKSNWSGGLGAMDVNGTMALDTIGLVIQSRLHLLVMILNTDPLHLHLDVDLLKSTFQPRKNRKESAAWFSRTPLIIAIVVCSYIFLVWLLACVKCISDRRRKKFRHVLAERFEQRMADGKLVATGEADGIMKKSASKQETLSLYENM